MILASVFIITELRAAALPASDKAKNPRRK